MVGIWAENWSKQGTRGGTRSSIHTIPRWKTWKRRPGSSVSGFGKPPTLFRHWSGGRSVIHAADRELRPAEYLAAYQSSKPSVDLSELHIAPRMVRIGDLDPDTEFHQVVRKIPQRLVDRCAVPGNPLPRDRDRSWRRFLCHPWKDSRCSTGKPGSSVPGRWDRQARRGLPTCLRFPLWER